MSVESEPKILVIDDEQFLADSLAAIFKAKGYEVAARYRPADGIAAAQSFRPNMLLSDVMLPELNGVELAVKIRSLLPDCKVLLMSGDSTTARSFLLQALKQGHEFDLLEKPIDPDDLLTRTKNLIGGERARRNYGATQWFPVEVQNADRTRWSR
jgi:DNA-binding response OmpR family regulator